MDEGKDELEYIFDPRGRLEDMDSGEVRERIHEMRTASLDDIDMTDSEIATILQS